MSNVEPTSTELKAQYAAQVAADLERNAKEQERIGTEVATLQEQLAALQNDQALLANLQRTLGGESPTAAGAAPEESATAAPSVPQQASAKTKAAKPRKATAVKPTKTPAKNSTKASAAAAKQPTLVELIRSHLGQQTEPRSAAEITAALAQAHPDRDIKPKVVRVTAEGLVAKGQVHRAKQGSSVFYTASESNPADTPAEAEQKDPVAA
ncbi:hypothetical protein [Streptomyces sp. NBC_00827]|uniref:hypothetical protein n=1 Tax=Streptomyces sp. NBC_00827 TaxID=2903677 RepID=UPI00386AE3BC|nr:hypothetical protein OG569_42295 [Streptomyces sp. NBC_00827]